MSSFLRFRGGITLLSRNYQGVILFVITVSATALQQWY